MNFSRSVVKSSVKLEAVSSETVQSLVLVKHKEIFTKQIFFQAFSWSFVGYILSQLIRLTSNLVLARLFAPENFGIMQLVFVFIQGLSMFSDLGISINIVQHKKGEDPSFLRSAWTLQVLRGFLIEIILICLALPLSSLYQLSLLAWLIPLAGLSAIIDGFASTNLIMLNRNMQLRKLTLIECISQLIGTIVMILSAWYWREVWTLVMGSLTSSALKTAYSHICLEGPRMKFEIFKEYVHEILRFGRWIFISSLSGFILSRLDRIVIGLYVSIKDLGLYAIAYALAMILYEFSQVVSSKVLIPFYSNLWRTQPSELRRKVFKARGILMLLMLPPLYVTFIWGKSVIQILYPEKYWEAGWMLQMLAIACCFKSITITYGPILLATGDSLRAMVLMISVSCLYVVSIMVGGHFFGILGIIWAIPVSEILNYPILVWAIHRYGVWSPWLDFIGFILTLIVIFTLGEFYG